MNTVRPLRVGIIGAGANTRTRHIPGLQAMPGVECAVVCNRSAVSSQQVADAFGIPRIAADWHEVVEDPAIDAICVGTWPYLHAPITIAALAAGKHVLTEARMARGLREAGDMLDAARARPNLVAQIVPAPMSLDLDATIVRLIDKGRIGRIREVCLTYTGGQYADAAAPFTWRQDYLLSGVNTLMSGICYEMVRRWVREDPVRVMAHGAVFSPERKRADGTTASVRIPETITVVGVYASGSRLVAHFSGIECGPPRNEVRIHGSRGALRVDLAGARLFVSGLGGDEEEIVVPAEQRLGWRVEEDFVASIRDGRPVTLTDFETGLAYMRFTEAMIRSHEADGAWIGLGQLVPGNADRCFDS